MYVHLDWQVGHYAKAVLDEVFSANSFQNEIVWKRKTVHSDSKAYKHIHEVASPGTMEVRRPPAGTFPV